MATDGETTLVEGDIGDLTTYHIPKEYLRVLGSVPVGIPVGILRNSDGTSAKKRCRCIEKKRNKVVKEIKYIPLAPVINLNGSPRNFTCNCSNLRKRVKT